MHESDSRGVGRKRFEMKVGIDRGIREGNMEGTVAAKRTNQELASGMILSGRDEGNITVEGGIGGFNEDLREIGVFVE